MTLDFASIDFETANASRSSACSVGVALVSDGRVVETAHWMIRQTHFEAANSRVHGITAHDVAHAPTFAEIWPQLHGMLRGRPVVPDRFALVDYKTSVAGEIKPLQLQLYASAGRREGLAVDAAYVHDMGSATRHTIDVSPTAVSEAERVVLEVIDGLKAREFKPSPERRKCASCDVRAICKAAKAR
jgi:CRISPR/Cas system-associated exonuclease Cas4 (RecB family)